MNQLTSIAGKRNDALADARRYGTTSSARPSPVRNASETAEKIEQTISYMMDHLNQPLQVATLASMAHVSVSHYFALFKRRTGCAPMDYFTRLRMEQASRLLDTTVANVKEVAASLGYDDPFYFSRVFKSVNGVAPTDYRRLEESCRRKIRNAALPVQNGCTATVQPYRVEQARAN